MTKLVFLQLNELNFPYVEGYIEQGYLPNFSRLFEDHGFVRTESETQHELVNPWIQWPTVHTGMDYVDHQVFRLGDIVKTNHPQIYEVLESNGVKVAAISPFNAKNNTKNPAFFVPDPWTKTRFDGSWTLRQLYEGLCEVADDYAKDAISPRAAWHLVMGAITHFRWRNFFHYLKDSYGYFVGRKKWLRALICDRLLFDAFLTQYDRHQPDFATLFLNGGAHLQHHYLFSSLAYKGPFKNPAWHVPPGADPLLDILNVYDEILGVLLNRRDHIRLLVGTGLHQDPHERTTYYYRLDDHASLLSRIGIDYEETYRLMTEDFVIKFSSSKAAEVAAGQLAGVHTVGRDDIFYRETADCAVRTMETSSAVFHIENRGDDLYVQLKPTAISMPANTSIQRDGVVIENFDKLVSFAQYKNTHHVGEGYFTDTAYRAGELEATMPLRQVFHHIVAIYGVGSEGSGGSRADSPAS